MVSVVSLVVSVVVVAVSVGVVPSAAAVELPGGPP